MHLNIHEWYQVFMPSADDALKSMECENNLIMFKAIAHLQVSLVQWMFLSCIQAFFFFTCSHFSFLQEDFDVFFTPSNYEDPNMRKQIQEHHITAYENTRGRHSSKKKATTTPVVANDPDGKTKTISTEADLRRLGRQLQRTEQELWSDLALRALRVGKVDKALKILRFVCLNVVLYVWIKGWETDGEYGKSLMFSFCSFLHATSELYEHHYNKSTGKVLFTAAKTLCQMLEADVPMVLPDDMDLPAVIHDLACQAMTVCHSGE